MLQGRSYSKRKLDYMNLLHKRKLDYMNRNTRDMNQLLPENNGNSFKAQEKQIKPSRQSED